MRLLFPISFGAFVFYVFAWPWFPIAYNTVARFVAMAVSH